MGGCCSAEDLSIGQFNPGSSMSGAAIKASLLAGEPLEEGPGGLLCAAILADAYVSPYSEATIPAHMNEGVLEQLEAKGKTLTKEAKNGNLNAQFVIGHLFDIGRDGAPLSTTEAVRWYTLSARQGNVQAQSNLGLLLASGHRGLVNPSPEVGLQWLERAAAQDNPAAQFHAALMLLKGKGVPGSDPDEKRAFAYLRKAAKSEHTMSEAMLGTAYVEGWGTPVDLTKGLNYLKKASLKDDSIALHNLGYMFANGLGVVKDMERSKAYQQLAMEGSSPDAIGDTLGEKCLSY